MAKRSILAGAFDTGPSKYVLEIANQAVGQNLGVVYIGNNATVSPSLIVDSIAFDYALVGGPSSLEKDLDSAIFQLAKLRGKPCFALCDVPRSYVRAVHSEVSEVVAIVPYVADIEGAKEFGYRDAVWLGYPSHWADPRKTESASNKVFGGVVSSMVKIFVCGLKEATVTDQMLEAVIWGMSNLVFRYHIYFQEHPSEIEGTKNTQRRAELLDNPNISVIRERAGVPEIIVACDVSVFTGAATGIIDGAILRCPMIYFESDRSRKYMMETTEEEIYTPAKNGCLITDSANIDAALHYALGDQDKKEELRKRQIEAFPDENGPRNTAKAIVEYILKS